MTVAAFLCAYHEERRIGPAVAQLLPHMDRILVLLSERPWNGEPEVDPDRTAWLLTKYYPTVEIVRGVWATETDQRNEGVERLQAAERVFVADADEYFTQAGLKAILATPAVFGCAVHQRTYWKTPDYRYEPPDEWKPIILLNPTLVKFREYRDVIWRDYLDICEHGWVLALVPEPGISHHFSFVLTDAECQRKMQAFSHAGTMREDWWQTWREWQPGSAAVVAPYPGLWSQAVYDPAPEEICTRYAAWQRVCAEEGIAA